MFRVSIGMSGTHLSFSREMEIALPLLPLASSCQWGTAEHSYRTRVRRGAWVIPMNCPPFLAPTIVPFILPFSPHCMYCLYELVGKHWTEKSSGDQEKGNIASWLKLLCPLPIVQSCFFSACSEPKEPSLWTVSYSALGPDAFQASASSLNCNSLPEGLLLPACFCEPLVARFVRIRLHPIQPEALDSRIYPNERS